MKRSLKFSFSIPTLNSEKYLEYCLESIMGQDYPKDNIEIIIADAGSVDRTLSIAAKYTSLIFDNKLKLGEYGTKIAVENATGDLFVVFAADNGLVGKDWLRRVSTIFEKHKDLSCFWGKMIASDDDPPIMHYYELIQSEPLAHFLNKELDLYLRKAKEEDYSGVAYKTFSVDPKRPLCWGANGIVYKLSDVKDLFFSGKYIGDNEIFQYMIESGKNKVAYSFQINIYHHTVSSVRQWVKKWKRNFTQIFLKTRKQRRIDWFYYGNFRIKMLLWLVYSLIPIFSISHSLYRMAYDRNVYWFYHPLLCFLQTSTYLYWTIILPEGRKALLDHIRKKQI